MATPFLDSNINPPDQAGYGYRPGKSFVQVELEGGQPFTQKDIQGKVHYLTARFSCTAQQYTYLMGFFRERIEDHTKIFRMNLVIDVPALVPYRCQVLGDPPELVEIQGLLHVVQGRFAVLPNPVKSFSLFLNNATSPRIIDAGTIDYSGEMQQFPVGRTVRITGSTQVVGSVSVNLDGDYTMDTAPDGASRTLLNAAVINPNWSLISGTQYHPTFGAAVLLPE